MAASAEGGFRARDALRLRELLASWWQHRASFLISVGITLAALVIYFFTFLGERATPLFTFLERLEYDSLDTRFRARPPEATPRDPRIVIVDIDQHSQEVLGRWPFSRSHFAKLLDVLKQDGAKTAAFDVTFSKPDQSGAAVNELARDLEERKRRGEPVDPKLEAQVRDLAAGQRLVSRGRGLQRTLPRVRFAARDTLRRRVVRSRRVGTAARRVAWVSDVWPRVPGRA